ncbi:hypothetical protein EDD11_000163 [Mortierella claussenii]|nr:hypothetical protein EDD11_000163 [Mortierella claussenii]
MVALTPQSLLQGLVLSLSLSSTLFLSAHAQSTTTAAGTGTATATTTGAPKPTGTGTTGPPINAPSGFLGLASASNKNFIFFQGGQINSRTVQYTNELYSLDMTKKWEISTPAWTNLTIPTSGTLMGPTVAGHDATMSKDQTTLLVTAPLGTAATPFLYQYNIAAGTWSTVNAPPAQAAKWANRRMANFVTDPDSGASWLLGGSFDDNSSTNEVDKFQDGSWTAALNATPVAGSSSSVLNNFSSGTAHVYNTKIFIFGGFSSTSGQRGYQSFQSLPFIDVSSSSAPTFGTQFTLGSVPPPRQDHCSVMTASQKVIIYGGYDGNAKTSLQDVWSLDMVTMTWSQIVTTNPTTPRHGHSCNIVGANMIVYGGVAVIPGKDQVGYVKDIQVYDVMASSWMNTYLPKQDTTPISKPLGGGSSSGSSGIGAPAIIGIVAGVVVLMACVLGLLFYKRRQKQLEIREAEMEKEAYLASLRPENGDFGGSKSAQTPGMPSPVRIHHGAASVVSTPGMSHAGAYSGMDELLLNNVATSPGMGGQGQPSQQGNVQYLMQHLPDGTIAVQPVYLDHQAIQMQHSPSIMSGESAHGFVSPLVTGASGGVASSTGGGGYFAPPPPPSTTNNISGAVVSPSGSNATSPYVLPPTLQQQQKPQVTYPQPTHDPFASPALSNAPLPPGYNSSHNHNNSSSSNHASLAASGLGSPQQIPDQLQ